MKCWGSLVGVDIRWWVVFWFCPLLKRVRCGYEVGPYGMRSRTDLLFRGCCSDRRRTRGLLRLTGMVLRFYSFGIALDHSFSAVNEIRISRVLMVLGDT